MMENQGNVHDDFPTLNWDASKNALYDRHIQPPMVKMMSAGDAGCAMSHANLWRILTAEEKGIAPMQVLEDDAAFYDNHSRSLNSQIAGVLQEKGSLKLLRTYGESCLPTGTFCTLDFHLEESGMNGTHWFPHFHYEFSDRNMGFTHMRMQLLGRRPRYCWRMARFVVRNDSDIGMSGRHED